MRTTLTLESLIRIAVEIVSSLPRVECCKRPMKTVARIHLYQCFSDREAGAESSRWWYQEAVVCIDAKLCLEVRG